MKRRLPAFFLAAATLWSQPTIRVTTRLVEVNVIVRGKQGPVAGLTRSDFAVFDRGKPREIAFFSVNSVREARTVVDPLPANVYSNAPQYRGIDPASATVVLFDGVNTSIADQIYAKKQFLAFLGQIQPQDRIAVYSLGNTLRVLNDFTADPGRLAATIARYRGRLDGSPDRPEPQVIETGDLKTDAIWNAFLQRESDTEMDKRVNLTVEGFEAIANRIAGIPGRKNLIWVSASFPFEIARRDNPKLYAREINRAARALNAANVAIYPVDARGLVGLPALHAGTQRAPSPGLQYTPEGHAPMDMLASATGGRAFKNNNDIKGAIRAVLDDSELTYTLAFHPDSQGLDGSFHRIKVQVNRPGIDVRHREGYVAEADPPATPEHRARALGRAIASPLEAAGIRARVQVDRAAGLAVSLILNAADLALDLADGRRTATLDAVFTQRAADGRELAAVTYTLRPSLEESQFREALEKGLGFAKTLAPAEGAVELKVVIFDRASGRIGSVIVPL
jgi:VWFA-related protein